MSGRIANIRPKPGYVMDAGGNIVQMRFRDGLANVVTGLGTRADARTARAYMANILSPEQIEAAYEGSWSLRKAVSIPATDRVRAWRDWQADADQIEALEAEEERLGLQAKVYQAEILRGLGGGAMILVGAGDPAMPLRVTGTGGLVAINLVSRWHITGKEWIDDISRPDYGAPTYWEMNGTAKRTRLHPSRVVCFRGEPLPSIWRADWEDRFWGRGRVPTLLEPAQNLDEALATFSAMIKDAMNVDIGIPKLLDLVSTADGEARLMKRLSLMSQGTSVINAKVFDSGDAEGKGGESIERHQVDWSGIPDVIRVYAEAMSAASGIPVTKFWGTSAKGLNATGKGDENDWNKQVATGQKLETRPCLLQIDEALIPSALGSRPPEVWWKFAELDVPTDKEEADRFKTWTEAAEKVQLSGAIPDVAFAKAYQNGLSENGWMPGLDGALAEVPEDERFGLTPDPNGTDPSALTQSDPQGAKGGGQQSAGGGNDPSGLPARRAANDARFIDGAAPKTLYIERKLLNADEVIRWAKSQGLETTLAPEGMHVTVAYSRKPLDWFSVGADWSGDEKGNIRVKPGGPRAVERLGDGDAVALLFGSDDLEWRHKRIVEAGASWDWPDYRPHVTLTWNAPGVDVSAIEPYAGPLVFGPELFSEVREDWSAGVTEE